MSEEQQAVEPSEPAGLLDTAEPEEAQASSQEDAAVEHRSAESIPDDEPLERPDWWPENFWKKEDNEPDLEAIAKSWTDMRKIVSQGKHKAPPDGKYDTSVFGENYENDPLAPTVLSWAKEHGISQAAFEDLVTKVNGVASELAPQGPSIEEEMKQLGPNAPAKINSMVNWARGMVNKGVFSAEDFEEFKIAGGTAKGLNMLMKLRSSYEGRMPIESQPIEGGESDEELRAMINDQYYKDPVYRAKVERKFQQRYGS